MEYLHEFKGWHLEGHTLVIDGGWEGKLRLTPALPGVVQVWFQQGTPWSQQAFPASLSVDPSRWPELEAPVVEEHDDHLLATFERVVVRVDKEPLRLHYWVVNADDETGELVPLLSDSKQGGVWKDGWQVGARFFLHPADQFYGLGEPDQHSGPIPFNHRGKRYPIWNKHLPAPSRLIMPVLVSHRGYGLFVDNPWAAEIDLGTDGQTFGYAAQGGQLVYYFIAGPALTDVLDRYTQLTGRPSLAPKWSFGLMQSKFGYRTWDEVGALVDTFEQKQIPLDTVILDLFWFKHMGDLAFDRAAFPDPAGALAALRARGIKIIVIEEPYITTKSRLFHEAERLGLLGKRTDGTTYTFPFWAGETGVFDFTQPLAKQFWADQHKVLMDQGVAGWWTDLNEPEEHPQEMIFRGGIAPAVHNVFVVHMLQSLALAQAQHKPHERLFILSRAGWPGTQALGAGQWSGDVASRWEALANQIPLGLSMAMAGMAYWNTDIGGFGHGTATPELYARWIQFGAFTPVMRPHGSHVEREPWAFGPEVEEIATRYIRLRYRLLPYTYTLAREANVSGLPFMRPLVLHYPEEKNTLNLVDQFLWGRDILVAPVTAEGQTSRKVYLPEGVWYDYWTNRKVRGGRYVTAQAPLEILPIFVRAGAIVPLAPERTNTGGAWEELTLAVYPAEEETSFSLYEDDGESTAFQGGTYAVTTFAATPEAEALTVTIGAPEGSFAGQVADRAYRLEVRVPTRPTAVTAGEGSVLQARRSLESLNRTAAPGWWYDQKLHVLHVKLGTVAGETRVTIR
ncbi:MAG TPA: TIM-barrel domain-containing protein [Symbiobacteriaceae bacterium]|nr:TIM-barrel domain-containing protein [Symbiobacteriaceae bacterium]